MEGVVQMAKINPQLKQKLKDKAAEEQKTMTDLVKEQFRMLLKSNGFSTI